MISGILMNEKPVSKDEIFKELDEYQAMDCCYSDGRILGSMCTEAHPIAKEAFYKFSDSNLGDPGLFKGTKLIEDEVLKIRRIYSSAKTLRNYFKCLKLFILCNKLNCRSLYS